MATGACAQTIPTIMRIEPRQCFEKTLGIELRQLIPLFEGKGSRDALMSTFILRAPYVPEVLRSKVLQFVSAGFFYNGGGNRPDLVQCAFCEVGLFGWTNEHDPMEEHRRHSPECPYLTD